MSIEYLRASYGRSVWVPIVHCVSMFLLVTFAVAVDGNGEVFGVPELPSILLVGTLAVTGAATAVILMLTRGWTWRVASLLALVVCTFLLISMVEELLLIVRN